MQLQLGAVLLGERRECCLVAGLGCSDEAALKLGGCRRRAHGVAWVMDFADARLI
jgi:hypothetical protein